MAKSRKKKNEKKDFKKVKLRVGKKVSKTKETKLSFVAKKICLREDAEREETTIPTSQVLYLNAILPRLTARRNDDLVSALNELRTWMQQQPEDARNLMLLELPTKLAPLVRHLDAKVRTAANKAFSVLLQLTNDLPAYHPALAQTMFAALLHFDVGVREAGWALLRQILEVAPRVLASLNVERLLDELGRRIPTQVASQGSVRAGTLLKIADLLVQTLEPPGNLQAAHLPITTSDLAQPFRSARFDFQPDALAKLWRSGHVPRAVEQGHGWSGTGRFRLAEFLGALSDWLLSLCKEFGDLDSALRVAEGRSRQFLLPRLSALLSLVTAALQLNLRRPLSTPVLRAYSSGAARLWQLFPVPPDAALFFGKAPAAPHRLNLALVRLRCLADASTDAEDAARLTAFFNDAMGPLWPLPRSLCLQWVACADLAALARCGGAWGDVLDDVMRKIAAVQPEGSKVAQACERATQALKRTTQRSSESE